jgi:hypothetical protein
MRGSYPDRSITHMEYVALKFFLPRWNMQPRQRVIVVVKYRSIGFYELIYCLLYQFSRISIATEPVQREHRSDLTFQKPPWLAINA